MIVMICKNHKLGDVMFNEYDMIEDLFAGNNACTKLGDGLLNEDDPLIACTFDKKIYYDDSMPPIYDDYDYESGFGRVSTLGSSDPTILEGVESYYNIDESGFGEVMTLFSDTSTILEEVSIDYDENKVSTYDDYYDETYAIKSSDDYIYNTFHYYDYPFLNITLLIRKQFIVFEFLMILPLFRRILLMWRVIKFICLWIMKRML